MMEESDELSLSRSSRRAGLPYTPPPCIRIYTVHLYTAGLRCMPDVPVALSPTQNPKHRQTATTVVPIFSIKSFVFARNLSFWNCRFRHERMCDLYAGMFDLHHLKPKYTPPPQLQWRLPHKERLPPHPLCRLCQRSRYAIRRR